ncbi:hypothetical protein [Paenibacillus wulumuqiensis]|uniref:hypothetical protein n=1 Tax=Paenibacillus wulumuqiensis TaxID=1567107 RepID=UPI0006194A6A|nr:hypothetical protein [Paenibacillus wulumuqiensis]
MSNNFGNVHVQIHDLQQLLTALEDMIADQPVHSIALSPSNPYREIIEEAEHTRHTYYIAEKKPGWFSILNDWFQWGKTEQFGEELSAYLNHPVFTLSYYNDEVLAISLFTNGEELTGYTWCNQSKDEYEIEEKDLDISILTQIFGYEYGAGLQHIAELSEQEGALDQLEELLQLPLRISSEFYADDKEKLTAQFAEFKWPQSDT